MPSTISAGTTAGTAIAIAGDTTGNLAFQTNGTTTAMTVDTSQNVGIGTTSPAYRLDVLNSAVDGGVRITGGGSGANLFLNNNGTGGRTYRVYSTGSLNAVGAGFFGVFDETAGLFRMGIDSSGNFQFNSGYGSAATAYGCRAWVNFNGTGTVAIRASGNVSSITDDGTGLYRINMTNAMSDTNYNLVATIGGGSNMFLVRDNSDAVSKTTTQFRINTASLSGPSDVDPPQVNVSVFR